MVLTLISDFPQLSRHWFRCPSGEGTTEINGTINGDTNGAYLTGDLAKGE